MSEDNGVRHDGSGGDGGKGSPSPRAVIPLPVKREVAPGHLDNLTASGLTAETIKLACLYTEHHHQRIAELLQRRSFARGQGTALVFPFYLPEQPEDVQPYAYRVRPTNPRVERKGNGGKDRVVKYDQASSAGLLVYFPPRARLGGSYRDTGAPLLWTEGEKKSLTLDQLGYPCIGLTGVWNWLDAEHRNDTREMRLHPHLAKYVTVAGRSHVIVYDSDSRKNDQVMKAAQRLAGVLRAAGATEVRFVCPPDDAHKGVDDYFAAYGEDATRALIATATELEAIAPDAPLQRLRSLQALRDTPLSEALLLPDGYEVQRDGSLWATGRDAKHGDTRVTHTPMFLIRTLVDHYTGDERVELMYERGERWVTQAVSRKAIADSRTLVAEAAPYGAPVTSNTAAKIVDWLDAFEDANPSIPRIACVSTGGWHTIGGVRLFAARVIVTPEEAQVSVAIDTRGDRRKMLAALEPRGTLDAHLDALRRAWVADPACALVICAAFASTLLEPLGAPNFAVHLVGESSRGKTSMLKIAASVFGDPNNPHWLASWSVTATGAELRAVVLCDLPQCYDEIGGGDPQAVEKLVYMLINGGGRTRAQRDLSMRETSSWRTIVLSTGEHELADESTATGAQVRVVQLPVRGFGELGASAVDALRDDGAANAGHAGEEWLRRVIEHDAEGWKELRAQLARVTKSLRGEARDALQGRVAAYFALLSVTESMLAEAFELGGREGQTMLGLFDNVAGRERVTSLAERARELIENWVLSEPDGFPDLEIGTAGDGEPRSKTGRTRYGFRRPDGTILLIPSEFKAFCARHRLSPRTVVREWLQLGWTQVDHEHVTKLFRLGLYGRIRFVVLQPADLASDEPSGTGNAP